MRGTFYRCLNIWPIIEQHFVHVFCLQLVVRLRFAIRNAKWTKEATLWLGILFRSCTGFSILEIKCYYSKCPQKYDTLKILAIILNCLWKLLSQCIKTPGGDVVIHILRPENVSGLKMGHTYISIWLKIQNYACVHSFAPCIVCTCVPKYEKLQTRLLTRDLGCFHPISSFRPRLSSRLVSYQQGWRENNYNGFHETSTRCLKQVENQDKSPI